MTEAMTHMDLDWGEVQDSLGSRGYDPVMTSSLVLRSRVPHSH